MVRRLLLFVLAGVVIGCGHFGKERPGRDSETSTSGRDSFQFRDTSWGMTKNQVSDIEKSRLLRTDEHQWLYEGTLGPYDVNISYEFSGDHLAVGRYLLDEEFADNREYISAFNYFCDRLSEKYGPPLEYKENWIKDRYKNEPLFHGIAVAFGDATYHSIWSNDDTEIFLTLLGQDNQCFLGISYISREYNLKDESNILNDL